ncbi:MAG: DUF465 domain-containing protein [Burkholderiales bacterium]|nr:DUF465 domain-containing protein [Burkholderiales bacterium]
MPTEHHPLIKDFPELRERIHALKGDSHFSRLERAYEELDKRVVRIEERIEHTSEDELERLKVERVRLKDELYRLLTATA